jgi:DNA polymerase-3 subunit beta
MKFICDGLDLSEALLKVSKACAVRTTVPILECVKISAYNDKLTLLASDGELSIQKEIKADVLEEGEICAPGKTFTDFVNKLVGVSVSFRTVDNGLEIKYGDNATMLQVLPATEFPVVDMNIGKDNFVIANAVFKKIVERCSFCCAQDDSRPILKGCLLDIDNGEITVTALDGFRMAVYKSEVLSGSGYLHIVCPARTMNEVSKMLSEDGELTVFVQNGMMMVKIENTTIMSRLYQGEFLNYKSITPTEFATSVTVDKNELCESVDRASIMIRGDKNNLIILEIKADGIRITSNSEVGNVSEKVKSTLVGPELRIAMNSKYILEAVKAFDAEKINIGFNTATSPFVLDSGKENDGFYLVLPVRTA